MVIFQRKMTWKRLSRANDNKFTDENIDHCQVDPYCLKFFDKSGVEWQDCNKRYRRSVVNTPYIEVGKYPLSKYHPKFISRTRKHFVH